MSISEHHKPQNKSTEVISWWKHYLVLKKSILESVRWEKQWTNLTKTDGAIDSWKSLRLKLDTITLPGGDPHETGTGLYLDQDAPSLCLSANWRKHMGRGGRWKRWAYLNFEILINAFSSLRFFNPGKPIIFYPWIIMKEFLEFWLRNTRFVFLRFGKRNQENNSWNTQV